MDLLALAVIIAVAVLVVALQCESLAAWAWDEWRAMRATTFAPPSTEFTKDDPRCKHVDAKLRSARRKMVRRGTRLLIKDRPAWQHLNPMGVKAKPLNVVVDMKAKKRA